MDCQLQWKIKGETKKTSIKAISEVQQETVFMKESLDPELVFVSFINTLEDSQRELLIYSTAV